MWASPPSRSGSVISIVNIKRSHGSTHCDTEKEGAKKVVTKLKCKVCAEFVEKIKGRKNFSDRWIVGAYSVTISNVRDHTKSDQHSHALALLKKQRSQSAGLGPSTYASIAQAFNTVGQ